MILRHLMTLMFALSLVCRLAYAMPGDSPIVIKFSHVVAPDTPKGKGAEYFRQRLQALTGGRVRVEVYPNSQLYKDREEMQALQLGAVQMLAPSLAKFGPLGLREFEVFDLPYIFDGYDELHKVTDGEIGRSLLKKLEGRGIVGLAFWDNGFKQMSASRPLLNPSDIKGLKMRIQASRVLDAQMRTLGAVPLEMAFSDVVKGLRTGAVDGTENPASNFLTQHMDDWQHHLTVTNHGYLGYAVIVNGRFWDRLPRDIQQHIRTAMAEATVVANDIARRDNEDALLRIKSGHKTVVVEPSSEQKQAWKTALLPVHRQMEERIGKDLIQKIYHQTGFKQEEAR